MAATEDPKHPRTARGTKDEATGGGLNDLLAGLLGSAGGADPTAALGGLLDQLGVGQGGGLEALVGQLAGGQGAKHAAPQAHPAAPAEGLPPELLQALQKHDPTGSQPGGVPDALKRAAEALGLPPALFEKLLPSLLAALPAAAQVLEPQPPAKPSSSVHKRPSTGAAKPKPQVSAGKPAETAGNTASHQPAEGAKPHPSTGSPKPSSSAKPRGSAKPSGAAKPSSGTKPRSSGNRRKPKSEPQTPGLDDILKALIK